MLLSNSTIEIRLDTMPLTKTADLQVTAARYFKEGLESELSLLYLCLEVAGRYVHSRSNEASQVVKKIRR